MTTAFLYSTQEPFTSTLGRAVVDSSGQHEALVHLRWWTDAAAEALVQVYVNDELLEATDDPAQRECWLVLDRTVNSRVELLAVAAADRETVHTPRPELLDGWSPRVRDRLPVGLLRDESLAVDSRIVVTLDGVEVAEGELWPGDVGRSGFGGLFGVGGFGHDAASGLGLGRGELGLGPLGTDGGAWRWKSDAVPPGPHDVTLTARDPGGSPLAPPLVLPTFHADAVPAPAGSLAILPDFTLTWSE